MNSRKRVSKSEDAQFKVIMVGMSGAGKSCLLTRYTKDQFISQHTVTVGVEFASKMIKIDDKFNVKLQIWDTAGQESFKSIIKSYYRNSSVVFLVYSIVNKASFQSLDSWLLEAKEHAPPNAMYVLIGTHLDQAEQKEVPAQEAQKWMTEKSCSLYFQTSSKTNENVCKAFDEVAKQLFYMRMTTGSSRVSSMSQAQKKVQLGGKEQIKKKECCN